MYISQSLAQIGETTATADKLDPEEGDILDQAKAKPVLEFEPGQREKPPKVLDQRQ